MSDHRYTSGQYGRDNPTWHDEDAAHKASAVVDFLRAQRYTPTSVADVGCGTGGVLWGVKAALDADGLATCTYQGWDIAPDAIRRASAVAEDRLSFSVGDFAQTGQRADLILCIDTFEHVADDVGFLRVLADRGARFLFRIPLDLSVLDAVRPHRMLAARRQWGHRHAYNRALAESVLAEAGYRVLATRYDRVPPAIEGRRARSVDRLRRAWFALAPDAAVRWLGGWSVLVWARRA